MTAYLLDTNIIAGIFHKEASIESALHQAFDTESTLYLSAVVYYETKRGLLKRDARKQMEALERLVDQFKWVDFLKDDWEEAARLWAERNRKGMPIADADLLIAVQAKRLGTILVTDNEWDFTGLGLQIENWRKA